MSGKTKQTLTINKQARESATTGCSSEDGCGLTRFPANDMGISGGQYQWIGNDRPGRSPEDVQRRINFFEARIAARKDPANCGKCGKPRDREGRMCVRCLNTQRRRVAKEKGRAVIEGGAYSVDQLAGMVLQMRREMDKIQTRFKLWQKAVGYRKALKYRTNAILRKYFSPVTKAEAMDYLSQTNHAYENEEA